MPVRNAEGEENKEQWVVDIERKYRSYDPMEYGEKKKRRSIYKWPNDLVAASSLSRHRAPRIVSLGPYHHGEEHLQPMEQHKERALHRILHRSNIPVTTFIQSLQDVGQELWDSYDNLDLNLSPHSFLRMMLFDGCFLLELLHTFETSVQPLFESDELSLVTVIRQDMVMLENQIPLLVLEKLLEVGKANITNNHEYLHLLVTNFYNFPFPINEPCLHILDIYRKCLIEDRRAQENETRFSLCSLLKLLLHLAQKELKRVGKGLKRVAITMLIAIPILVSWLLHGRRFRRHGHFRTATRLHEVGIEFKKGEADSGLTITFDENNGVLTLPHIKLTDSSPIFYMNLIAFERMHPPLSGNKRVSDYLSLMDQLIDTAEDVSVLCSQGILSNHLGSDEDAAKLFNAFSNGLIVNLDTTLASHKQLQDYTASAWNLAIAYLKHNYFQNPWAVVSLLAALILLVLTFIQTVFSGMQVRKDSK